MAFPTSGCVAYYRLDDGSGTTATDATGNGNNVSLVGTPTWTTSGQINGALTLNGTSQYGTLATLSTAITTAGTIAAWVKAASSDEGGYHAILMIRPTSANGFGLFVSGLGAHNTLTGMWNNTTAEYNADTGLVIPTSTWAFAAVTADPVANALTVYLNSGSFSISETISSGTFGTNLTIGSDSFSYTGRGWNGSIDEVGIWNRALTSAEVTTLYNGGTGLSFPGGGGSTTSLFRQSNLNGLGSGGPFFNNPLGRSMLGWVPTLKGLLVPELVSA